MINSVLLIACSAPVEVQVRLVDPCNKKVIETLDYLTFEPRGEGIDSDALSTVEATSAGESVPIEIPLVAHFQMVVTGHKGSFDAPPSAIGVSAEMDLVGLEESATVLVMMAGVDDFHRTASRADPQQCTSLETARFGATATYLPEIDRVIIIGGARVESGKIQYADTVELYDPSTGELSAVEDSRGSVERAFHTTTLLDRSRLLVAGGESAADGGQALKTAVVVDASDPEKIRISDGILMGEARTGHVAARVESGLVIVAGGHAPGTNATGPGDYSYLDSIEIFDPDGLAFGFAKLATEEPAVLGRARSGASATVLSSGSDILIAGGFDQDGAAPSFELIQVQGAGTVQVDTSSVVMSVGPIAHAAALVEDGRVLLSGGFDSLEDAFANPRPTNPSSEVEMLAFELGTITATQSCSARMMSARAGHTLTPLGRRLLTVGGRTTDGSATNTAELVTMTIGQNCFAAPPTTVKMTEPRTGHTAAAMDNGEILIVGGRTDDGSSIDASAVTEIFSPLRSP